MIRKLQLQSRFPLRFPLRFPSGLSLGSSRRSPRGSLSLIVVAVLVSVSLGSAVLVSRATAQLQPSSPSNQNSDKELPWRKKEESDALSFRELLEPIGFDDAFWDAFGHGDTLDSDSTLQAFRLLDRLSAFTPDQWTSWRETLPPTAILSSADRGRIYEVQGIVTSVEGPYLLADEGLQGFRMESYYIVNVASFNAASVDDTSVDDTSIGAERQTHRIICQRVPQAWVERKNLAEVCALDGVLIASGSDAPTWFAADRIRWYSDDRIGSDANDGSDVNDGSDAKGNKRIKLPQAWQFLGRNGVDMGRIEGMLKRNSLPLNSDERDIFYPTLSLLSKAPDDWQDVASTPWSLTDVLRAPKDYQGQRLQGRATARRVTKVLVDDPAITRRFGIDAYYQVDVFFPLEGAKIRLTSPNAENKEDSPTYTNGYPGTIVCLTLPKRLATAAQKVLDGTAKTQLIQVPLEVDGIFLKIWSYRSPFLIRGENDQTHPSPLFIAARLEPVEPPQPGKGSFFSLLILAGFVCLFAGALAMGWWANQGSTRRG